MEFEHVNKGVLSGITTGVSGFGVFAASLLVKFFNTGEISHFFSPNTSWRYPFILAGIIVEFLGWYLRLNLTETPLFNSIQRQQQIYKHPVIEVIRRMSRQLLTTILLSAYTGIIIIVIEVYLPSYLQKELGISKSLALTLSTYLALVEAILAILCGWLSNYLQRRMLFMLSAIGMILLVWPLFLLLEVHITALLFLSATLLALLVAMADGPIAAILIDSFPTQVRYSGSTLSYNIGAAIIGGSAPFIIQLLPKTILTIPVPAFYIMIFSLIVVLIMIAGVKHRSVNQS